MKSSASYYKMRDAVCSAAIRTSRSLDEYFQQCEGLFPTEARDVLLSFKDGERIFHDLSAHQSLPSRDAFIERSSFLHSTWDFSEKTSQYIADEIEKNIGRTLFLGTPSVAKKLAKKFTDFSHLIIDIDPQRLTSINNIGIIQYDINLLSGKEFRGAFDICVFDPPWYIHHYLHWLDVAFQSCRAGAKIIFPLFGKLTRPSAADDREKILRRCAEFGARTELRSGQATYKIPSFERGILERAGIHPVTWKRADIAVVQIGKSTQESLLPHICPPAPVVESYTINDKLIELAIDRHLSNEIDLWAEPPGGFQMPNPSIRDDGNRISNMFISNGTRIICNRPIDIVRIMRDISQRQREDQILMLEKIGFPAHVLSK